MNYRNCEITQSTDNAYANYEWSHQDYDGAPDSPTNHLCGYGKSRVECMQDIDDRLDGEE